MRKRSLYRLLLSHVCLLALLVLLACKPNRIDPDLVLMQVAERQQDCYGPFLTKCMLVKEGDETRWQLFYGSIGGFTYEEGYTYELLVKKIPVKNPPADGSSIRYELVTLNRKTKV